MRTQAGNWSIGNLKSTLVNLELMPRDSLRVSDEWQMAYELFEIMYAMDIRS